MAQSSRRDLLAAFLGTPFALSLGCSGSEDLSWDGELVGDHHQIGHRLRDGHRPQPAIDAYESVGTVIVGGGIAGLSAAWRLRRGHDDDFVILELADQAGGTSRFDSSPLVSYPWGAHYLPMPLADNAALVALLDEMGVLDGTDEFGQPVAKEQFLCRDPQERLFIDGNWQRGLYPRSGATTNDESEWLRFDQKIQEWVAWRDSQGRRAFCLPVARCSDAPEVVALDRITMRQWLRDHGFQSTRLHWIVDYACRDDYGITADDASAWAGLFYFASRVREPGLESQPFLTWPEGNGRIVRHLVGEVGAQLRSGFAVSEIKPSESKTTVVAIDRKVGQARGWHADQVIFAAPQYLARYLIPDLGDDSLRANASTSFQYGAWMVANIHLTERPRENDSFPLAWDNVLYQSPSLGYVVATHQDGRDYGPTVFTYYYPLCESGSAARSRLLGTGWAEWSEVAMSDLERAHPDIRQLTERIDVMRWGHAMIRPLPGFVHGPERSSACQPFRSVCFANTDLSAVALCEEAFYHGVRAAEEVMNRKGIEFKSML